MKRLRVLHCIYDDPANPWVGGGGALRVLELYRRLADRMDVTVATGAFPGARAETIDGVRYVRLGMPRPYLLSRLSYGAAATRMLARAEYDVGVFDFSGYTPIRLPSGRRTAIVVHMLHGPAAAGRWGSGGAALLRSFERAMLRRTGDICVTSDWLRREIEPLAREGTRFYLVRSGVPDEFFALERHDGAFQSTAQLVSAGEGAPFLYYGRFDVYQKGLDLLLEAWSALAAEGSAPRLQLLGRGKDAARARELIARHGLGNVVSLRENPARPDVLAAMAGASVLVYPSRFEGLPMVPAEAMAAGLPVIATDVGAVAEVVGGGGLLVAGGSADAIRDAVRRMQEDPALRSALAAEARRSAQHFRWDEVAERHAAFLEAVAAGAGGGAAPIGPARTAP